MNEGKLDSVLSHAAALMNDERFNMLVESKASRTSRAAKKNKGMIGGSGGGSDISALEAAVGFGGSSRQSSRQSMNEDFQMANIDQIKQSFKEQPAMSGYNMGVPTSYYESQQRGQIREQYAPQPQPQYQTQGIDYNYLKFLINECIKENLNQLNESANLSSLKMAGGNKIQFIDSKGNVYEGTLKRIK